MALGDSITAGLFAQPSKLEEESQILVNERNQKPFQPRSSKHPNFKDGEHSSPFLGGFEEYRGRSYAMGGDKDAITIPQLMQHYRTDPIKGTSHNHHPPPILPAPPRTHVGVEFCLAIGDHVARNDGLNAAVSGAKAVDIPNQVKSPFELPCLPRHFPLLRTYAYIALSRSDYLLPSLKEFDVDDSEWKFLTLSIGANDVCDYCLVGNASRLGPGSPEAFVSSIETSIELVRQNIPRTIVNVVGLFTVSEIYNLTMKAPACSPLSLPPIFPRLPLECSCAWAPGPLGDATRRKMDALGEQYAHGLQQMVKRIRENVEREAIGGAVDFGIIWYDDQISVLESVV
ncbi:hypothetical protein QFC21_002787 [Naganishia friedmannii]|uniref:Uncharacterized protein n=1 Tax=Naganishia friedmannii TaxID=89922 RepID=A0ACC2VU12_9TREE|nr:hypothetical protein QFC21_002787 [Naganishia friedmannii]